MVFLSVQEKCCLVFQCLIDVHPTATIESQQKALNCVALDSSHSLGYMPIMKTHRSDGYWQIQSHYFHQTHTHWYTPLYAVNLHASSPVVLSHCRQGIYACMDLWLARLLLSWFFSILAFPNNPAPAPTLQMSGFGINLPESRGIDTYWNEHKVEGNICCALVTINAPTPIFSCQTPLHTA